MQHALSDFRIENESVVLLAFADGSNYRVNPQDLEQYLTNGDLLKVREALALRHQFIKRVLPPTAMILLICGILGLGTYDTQRVAALLQPGPTTCVDTSELQAAYQSVGLGGLGTRLPATTGSSGRNVTNTSSMSPASITEPVGVQKVSQPAVVRSQTVTSPAVQAQPLNQVVQQVAKPVGTIVNQPLAPVTHTLTPVVAPVESLTNNLPVVNQVTNPLLNILH